MNISAGSFVSVVIPCFNQARFLTDALARGLADDDGAEERFL